MVSICMHTLGEGCRLNSGTAGAATACVHAAGVHGVLWGARSWAGATDLLGHVTPTCGLGYD